jgi:hypothetical protein
LTKIKYAATGWSNAVPPLSLRNGRHLIRHRTAWPNLASDGEARFYQHVLRRAKRLSGRDIKARRTRSSATIASTSSGY